ncbi:MAG: GNAT family N-acetyltransferase [Verrucomicrobia bacterium]|nr:MAG: GNAT family N-acetyltransferase [Verrucomicrobiota bacterium]
MRVERYQESDKEAWDAFVRQSKNGTFLFLRDYMDYHRARFEDHSLVIRDDDDRIAALLPANVRDQLLSSHAGLTYGGFVADEQMKLPKMLVVFEAALSFLKDRSFAALVYKCVPHIYHRAAAEEDLYALFLCNAKLRRRGALTVVEGAHRLAVQERRRRGARKAQKNGVVVRQSDDLPTYWEILNERLLSTYGTRPAHAVEELQLLRSRFPNHIKLFAAYQEGTMLAGVVIYESYNVAHAQYIAANERSRTLGALDLIFEELLDNIYQSKKYFAFGTSDEQEGRKLNRGLIDQKEGYGARVVAHDHYELNLADWTPGQLIEALA